MAQKGSSRSRQAVQSTSKKALAPKQALAKVRARQSTQTNQGKLAG